MRSATFFIAFLTIATINCINNVSSAPVDPLYHDLAVDFRKDGWTFLKIGCFLKYLEYKGVNEKSSKLLYSEQLAQLGRDGAVICDFVEKDIFKNFHEIPPVVVENVMMRNVSENEVDSNGENVDLKTQESIDKFNNMPNVTVDYSKITF